MEVLSSYIVLFYVQKSSVEIDEDSFILQKKKKSLLNMEWECIAYIQPFSNLMCLLIILRIFSSFA